MHGLGGRYGSISWGLDGHLCSYEPMALSTPEKLFTRHLTIDSYANNLSGVGCGCKRRRKCLSSVLKEPEGKRRPSVFFNDCKL